MISPCLYAGLSLLLDLPLCAALLNVSCQHFYFYPIFVWQVCTTYRNPSSSVWPTASTPWSWQCHVFNEVCYPWICNDCRSLFGNQNNRNPSHNCCAVDNEICHQSAPFTLLQLRERVKVAALVTVKSLKRMALNSKPVVLRNDKYFGSSLDAKNSSGNELTRVMWFHSAERSALMWNMHS